MPTRAPIVDTVRVSWYSDIMNQPTLPDGFRLHSRMYASADWEWARTTARELDALAESLALKCPTFRMFGREHATPRLVGLFGSAPYTYSRQRHEPAPMPTWMQIVHADVERQAGARFNSVLVNYYRDGQDSIAWHADDEPELGPEPVIASLSFGATRRFDIRTITAPRKTTSIHLAHGDLLVMRGRAQRDYQHSIPKAHAMVGARLNLTFRWIAA